jgi:ABC-2 type transport system ATP-binding protein
MYVRLGFAVAINMEPDVLLIDEVLAVGDELFQRKCLERIRQFQREGRTIVFVTHAPDMVRSICNRVAVLHDGKQVAWGEPAAAVRSYREHLLTRNAFTEEAAQLVTAMSESEWVREADEPGGGPKIDHRVSITSVTFQNPDLGGSDLVPGGGPMRASIGYRATEAVEDIIAVIAVYDSGGRMLFMWRSDYMAGPSGPIDAGEGEFCFTFESVPLVEGTYPVSVGLHTVDGMTVYEWRDKRSNLNVINSHSMSGLLYLPATVELSTAADARALGPPED